MARLETLGKSLGWRMVLLLFWTIFVCCVLYASSGSQVPDISREYMQSFSFARQKRVSGNQSRQPGQCRATVPTREDWAVLGRVFQSRKHQREKPTVHCSVVSACDKDKTFHADCFSSECSVYKIKLKDGIRVFQSISNEKLSRVVENSLRENSFMTIEDLGKYMNLQCEDPASLKVEISGDILSNPLCKKMESPEAGMRSSNNRTIMKAVNVFYFRFLSQLELPERFPALFSFLKDSMKRKTLRMMNLDKHQAIRWGDDEALSFLLQGHTGLFSYNDSILDSLHQAGYCFRVEDFSCSRSRRQEAFLADVLSVGEVSCKDHPPSHREPVLDRLCTEGNLTDTETRAALTSLLSSVHDTERWTVGSRPLFSLSIVNTRDFQNFDILDQTLKNIFFNIAREDNRVLLIVSGQGNPTFLRFDQSVRLQPQASNPAMMLVSTGSVSATLHSDFQQLNHSLFSLQHVHLFLKTLIEGGPLLSPPPDDAFQENEGPDTCGNINVKPPFTCLCEDQFVAYENDSLMVGFAEFAVSVINSQLRNLEPQQRSSQCARVSGLSFTDIRVSHHGNKKRIKMDLNLENDLTRDRVLRRTVLDIWDIDKIPQAEVQFFELNSPALVPLNFQTDRLFKTLCQTGESLDLASTSQTGLSKRWSKEKHFGRKARMTPVHDDCLYLFVRDFGDCISVAMGNACNDRRYDVMLHLSLMNMISLNALPLSAHLGHAQREDLAVIVKVSYTVPTFAYKLHPDFDVSYDD